MFSLTVVFGPSPVPWVLLFKSEEAAKSAYSNLSVAIDKGVFFTASDDFGQDIAVRASEVHGTMVEDMELSKLAHIEQGLHRARTQAKAQSMAQGDPVLKAAAMMGGAPMLQPGFGPNGAFRGQ